MQKNVHAQLCGYHLILTRSFCFVSVFGHTGRFEIKLQNLPRLVLNLKVCGSQIDLRYKSIAFKLSEISFVQRLIQRLEEESFFLEIVWFVYSKISEIKEIHQFIQRRQPQRQQTKRKRQAFCSIDCSIYRLASAFFANCIKVFPCCMQSLFPTN